MPIGDLLAEITGEKPASAPPRAPVIKPATTTTITTTNGLKRKADGDSNSNGIPSKAVKQSQSGVRDLITRKPSPPISRPATVAKPMASSINGQRPGASGSAPISRDKPYTGTATPGRVIRKPETLTSLPSRKDSTAPNARLGSSSVTLNALKVAPPKPSPTTPTSAGPSKVPKKGSFAEIMARGAKAQQIAPKAGLIQHKAIGQTVLSKRERDEQKSKWKSGKVANDGRSSTIPSRDKLAPGARNGGTAQPASKGNSRPVSAGKDAPEKKLKKAAMVSTGYTGTARPATTKASDAKATTSSSSRARPAGGLLAPPRTTRRDRFADEDSDMDGFIDDDEDEEDTAPRGYRYADEYDSDSDMEAGADDIYLEEQRALRQAREDDAREEALLEKLKRDKEARKNRGGY
ncbi:hypothetical protein AB5N19_05539 [Seiridium cardinale]|uniref:SPT2 chromatin protein n=1 Tax=Seiridium cardinale TaxID=138064 RepID=A0ABR2XDG5_9PEZI